MDPNGGMLTQSWEPFADALANASDPEDLIRVTYHLSLYLGLLHVLFIPLLFLFCLEILLMGWRRNLLWIV